MNEPASIQLPRVNISTIVGVTIPVLMFLGALLSVFYTFVVSKTQVELNQIALEKRLTAFEELVKTQNEASGRRTDIQTEAIRSLEGRLSHLDDTIANLKIQVTPKH